MGVVTLVVQPDEQITRVVAGRVVLYPAIVGNCAVEHRIAHILQVQLGDKPRQVVLLGNMAAIRRTICWRRIDSDAPPKRLLFRVVAARISRCPAQARGIALLAGGFLAD
jgi:hypothetical protein